MKKSNNIFKKIKNMFNLNQKSHENSSKNEESMQDEQKMQDKECLQNEQNMQNEQSSTDKAKIHNLIIVDESGSMSHLRSATLSGINETINTIKSAQKEFAETQSHTLTLVTFDRSNRINIRYHIDGAPIDSVSEFNYYQPCGTTPLYDAMGITLTSLLNNIKDDEKATAVVTVLTDGLENASRKWDAQNLRQLISQLKERGWTFSYMGSAHNVKDVADLLSINNYMEFSHDNRDADNTWERERSSRRMHFAKMHNAMSNEHFSNFEAFASRMKDFAEEYYGDRNTPENISTLKPNEIFVFGSNYEGNHNGGAAAFALNFGAVMGQSEGPQGQTYAIPTTGSREQLQNAISRFIAFAAKHPELHFLVTRIGCGHAGYSPQEIAPLFKPCIKLENVSLPREFWEILGLRM